MAADVERYREDARKVQDEAARKKAAEAAGRLQFQREIEQLRRMVFTAGFENPLVRTFSPNDPNRLP